MLRAKVFFYTHPPMPHTAARATLTVLDTNVIMALWFFHDPNLASLQHAIDQGTLRLLTQADCLVELQRVLAYPRFALDDATQAQVLADYQAAAHCLPEPNPAEQQTLAALPKCKDQDDQKFLQLAYRSGAQLLLTRDKLVLKLARRPVWREQLSIQTPEKWVKAQETKHL